VAVAVAMAMATAEAGPPEGNEWGEMEQGSSVNPPRACNVPVCIIHGRNQFSPTKNSQLVFPISEFSSSKFAYLQPIYLVLVWC
jgi:hypothetical protein